MEAHVQGAATVETHVPSQLVSQQGLALEPASHGV